MINLFYIFGLFAIVWEFKNLINPKQRFEKYLAFTNNVRENSDLMGTKMFLYQLWIVIGIMTPQGLLFLILFLMSFVPKIKLWWWVVDGLITLPILLAIILNGLFFQVNLTEIFSLYIIK